MYMLKTDGMIPKIPMTKAASTNNNINISVNANNATGLDIARAIERQMVRRLSK